MEPINNSTSPSHQGNPSGEETFLSASNECLSQLFQEPPVQDKHNADHNNTHNTQVAKNCCENSEIQQTSETTKTDSAEDTEEEPELEPQDQLLLALKNDKFENFLSLLGQPGVDPKFKYEKPDYTTCIELACRLPWGGKFVQVLLNHGVKPNVHEIHQEPIHYAAKYGNPKALETLLLNKMTKLNILDSQGRTALHHAVRFSQKDRDAEYERCIELLLKRPELLINIPNSNGFTAVHEAANFSKKAVQLILKYRKHDVDLDSFKAKGRTARDCIQSNYPELSPLLPDYRVKYQTLDHHSQLLSALKNRQLKIFNDILCLVDEEGKARVDPNHYYGKPYFATCLEIACKQKDCAEYVKKLLSAGADPNSVNPKTNQTPFHLAVKMQNIRVLSVLLQDKRTNVNAVNEEGKTVKDVIAEQEIQIQDEETMQDTEVKEDKEALQDTEVKEDKEALPTLISILKKRNSEIRRAICKDYRDSEAKLPTQVNEERLKLAHRLFQHLYDRRCEVFRNDFSEEYKDIDNGSCTLLQCATLNSLEDAVRVLLESGANPNATTKFEKRPPIIIVSMRKDNQIMKLLLGSVPKNKLNVNVTDAKGNTALHHASRNENLDCVVYLIRRGADIRHKNIFDKPPLAAKSVEKFLAKSLEPNNKCPEDEEYKIIFDYSFLLAYKEQSREPYLPQECEQPLIQDEESGNKNGQFLDKLNTEMDFLFYISRSNDYRKLMQHPIITSFLHMKWQRVRTYFYLNLCIYAIFAILLNSYILFKMADNKTDGNESMVNPNDTKTSQSKSMGSKFEPAAWGFILFLLLYITVREILQLALSSKVYFTNVENILDLSILFSSACILFLPEWPKSLVVITILLSWTELILLTGRLPKLSMNIEMLKTVSLNYFWFLISYIFLIIAFAFSFYSLFHKNITHSRANYDDRDDQYFFMTPLMAVMKTFVMMTGEFETDNMVFEMANSWTHFSLFALFVFIMSMVLLNLLTGLAVSDTQEIKSNAEQLSLVSRIRLIYEIETTLLQWHTFVEKLPKYRVLCPFMNFQRSLLKKIRLFPDASYTQMIHVLPNKGPNIVFKSNEENKSEGEDEYDTVDAKKQHSSTKFPLIHKFVTRCFGQNKSSKMDLVIISEAISIISNRGLESEVNNIQQNLNQIQETLKENESNVSQLREKMDNLIAQIKDTYAANKNVTEVA